MIVIAIIALIFSLALPNYNKAKEQNLDREAQRNLLLLQAAQKIYFMENGEFLSAPDTAPGHLQAINTNLKLSLSQQEPLFWDYFIKANNGAIPKSYCAEAKRVSGGRTQSWHIDNTKNETESGPCSP